MGQKHRKPHPASSHGHCLERLTLAMLQTLQPSTDCLSERIHGCKSWSALLGEKATWVYAVRRAVITADFIAVIMRHSLSLGPG